LLDDLSEMKGILNRCRRKDQGDWFTLYQLLEEPSAGILEIAANNTIPSSGGNSLSNVELAGGELRFSFNLLGGAHKRVAKLSKISVQVRNSIRMSAANYQRVYEHDVTRGTIRHYPVVNWLALQAILRNAPGNWDALLKDAQLNARESFARDRTAPDAVFDAVAAADITVVRGLISGLLGKPGKVRDDQIARIAALYRDAFRLTHATLRQRESTTKQLEMLEFFMEKLGDRSRATGLMIRALKTIREQLL